MKKLLSADGILYCLDVQFIIQLHIVAHLIPDM